MTYRGVCSHLNRLEDELLVELIDLSLGDELGRSLLSPFQHICRPELRE